MKKSLDNRKSKRNNSKREEKRQMLGLKKLSREPRKQRKEN